MIGERLDIRMNITFPHLPCASIILWGEITDFSVVAGCDGCEW